MRNIALGITGASGSIYALRLIEELLKQDIILHLVISDAALVVFATELNINLPKSLTDKIDFFCTRFNVDKTKLKIYSDKDWFSPMASGSANLDAMVVCPCSSGALSAIVNGASNNLLERAADVFLKERKKLILVTRETPLNQIHLENMLKMTQLGAVIMPASPGFYLQPQSIMDLVDFIVARILSHLDINQKLVAKWGEQA